MRNRRFRRLPRLDNELKKTIWIYVGIFALAFIVFCIIFNFRKGYSTDEMEAASMPTISSEAFGTKVTELHGYINEMDACYMRDSVIPIDSKRNLPLTINTYGKEVSKISYEVRSTDTTRKIAETQIKDFTQKDDKISLNLEIENLIEANEEYLFIITLKADGEEIHYYTRVIMPENCHEKECYDFVANFHNTSLNGNYIELAPYMETSPEANQNTLSEVTLQSTVDQVGFSGFEASEVNDPIIEVKDINTDYCVFEMTYQLKLDNNGNNEFYNVKEYYKVRYTTDRIFILDYRRNMEQILNKNTVSKEDNLLNLGITSTSPNYLSNETGSITCFEQAGELFEYNQNSGELIKLFSFLDGAENDSRCYYNEHSIKILSIGENGDVTFAVYGYMNRGPHEGYCGIDLYKYNASSKKSIEQAFVATTCSHQILSASFSDLLYKASEKYFYVMISGTLVKIDLNSLTMENILEGLQSTQYAASKSGRYIAYTKEANKDDTLIVEDLSNESTFTITCDKDEYIRPLAFMDEDLVYGIVKKNDVDVNVAGATVYPVSNIYIIQTSNSKHPVLKEYHKDGYYVTDADLQSYTLYLDRVQKSPEGYVSAPEDTIKNSGGELGRAVEFVFTKDPVKGEITQLQSIKPDSKTTLPDLTWQIAKTHFNSMRKTITVNAKSANAEYFVYVGSQVVYASNSVSDAISRADEEMGVVVDNNSNYIWKRGRKSYKNAFDGMKVNDTDAKSDNISKAVSAMLTRENINMEVKSHTDNGESAYNILKDAMKNYNVLDLTGCNLNEMLYFVSIGNPVYAKTGPDTAVLIVGYDAATIVVYNPANASYNKMYQLEADNLFSRNGNVFITYVKNNE